MNDNHAETQTEARTPVESLSDLESLVTSGETLFAGDESALDHYVVATTHEGRVVPIFDGASGRDVFTAAEAEEVAAVYRLKVPEYRYEARSAREAAEDLHAAGQPALGPPPVVEAYRQVQARAACLAAFRAAAARLDDERATEAEVRRTFEGGDLPATVLEDHALCEHLDHVGEPDEAFDAQVRAVVEDAVRRAAERDAEEAVATAAMVGAPWWAVEPEGHVEPEETASLWAEILAEAPPRPAAADRHDDWYVDSDVEQDWWVK